MNQLNSKKADLFFNKKLFEMRSKNPGNQLASLSCDPNLNQYILGKREESSIFDFDYTLICIERCLKLVSKIIASKGQILIVSTDPSSSPIVKKVGQLSSQPFINTKWINGLLTNWKQIIPHKQNKQFTPNQKQDDIFSLSRLPDALIIVNPHENADAIREAKKLNIPVISFLNTKKKSNSKSGISLDFIDYIIPASGTSTQIVYLFFDLFIRTIQKNPYSSITEPYQYNYLYLKQTKYSYTY